MEKSKRDLLEGSVRVLAAMPEGRCFLRWLLARCDVRGPVFVGDHETACRREALRQLGREIEDLVAVSYGRRAVVDIEEEDRPPSGAPAGGTTRCGRLSGERRGD